MNRVLLWFIPFLLYFQSLLAQNFTWQADTLSKTANPGNTVIIHFYLINNTANQQQLRVIRFQNLLPQDWFSSFCVGGVKGTCYNPFLDTILIDLDGGTQIELALDFSTSRIPAEGEIGIRIENTANQSEFYENNFSVSTLATYLGKSPESRIDYKLYKNYPNPFNPSTNIPFQIGGSLKQRTVITVYNIIGQFIKIILSEEVTPGYHSVIWDGKDSQGNAVASGLYLVELRTENHIFRGKMFLLR